jgi:sarcosine oxidase, subunit beta
MARIAVGGAGAIGASIAYHLAVAGAADIVLLDRGEVGSGSTAKAMGGIRQQFSTAAEVRLAQESISFFEQLGAPMFEQVGYLFVASTEDGLKALEARTELQKLLGVPVEPVAPAAIGAIAPGVHTGDLLGGVICRQDGVADPPAVTRELVRRAAELGVRVLEHVPVEDVDADVRVLACGAYTADVARGYGLDLPVRPLVRQLFETSPLDDLPTGLPMVLEAESGFHFRRRGECLRVAMPDPEPRWGFEATVEESLLAERLERLARRYPRAAGATVARAWAGLYDMTPDAHPIIGLARDDVYVACGFSGHGFMQSPAVGRAVADELLRGESQLDLTPYRLDRFSAGATFPEEVVL